MLVISHVYELPFGAGRQFVNHGAMSYVVGGWDLSGLWTWYSGMHFDPVNGVSNISGTQYPGGTNYQRPNVVAGCNPNDVPGGATIQEWFNTACFTLPQLGTFGNSGAYTLLGPGLFTVDLGLHRNFRIKETIRLQVRWETFNTTNHANFDPGASAYTAPVNATGPGAGVITSTFSSRVMQLAMKLNF